MLNTPLVDVFMIKPNQYRQIAGAALHKQYRYDECQV